MTDRYRDPKEEGWERSDFPILCETCLGPNPYVRMQRMEFGGACHISGRPYTVFRWQPGPKARFKKTVVCQEVAKAKNVCQCCLLDLETSLPVQVRDQALGVEADIPQSDVGREFQLKQMEKSGELDERQENYGKAAASNEMLARLRRNREPYYKRNEARTCTFWVKGKCTRGAECPYKHEMPRTGPLSKQNMKDRYYGVNDPVAEKILGRASQMPSLEPPADPTIRTLWVGGVPEDANEGDIRDQFYGYGEVENVHILRAKRCAFVTYTMRTAAESAAKALAGKVYVKGEKVVINWAKAKPAGAAPQGGPPPGPGGAYGGYAQGAPAPAAYPSMDPSAMGSAPVRAHGPPAGVPGRPMPPPGMYGMPAPWMRPPGAMPPPGMYGAYRPPGAPGPRPAGPPPAGAGPAAAPAGGAKQ